VDADNLILVARVLAVKHEGCKLAREMRRRAPDLDVRAVPDREELAARRERDGAHGLLEVHVVQDCALAEVDEEGAAIWEV
jgi:hypothetical protein